MPHCFPHNFPCGGFFCLSGKPRRHLLHLLSLFFCQRTFLNFTMIHPGCSPSIYIFTFYHSSHAVSVDHDVAIDYNCGKSKALFHHLFPPRILCWYENNCLPWKILDRAENFVFACASIYTETESAFGSWWKSEGTCVGWNQGGLVRLPGEMLTWRCWCVHDSGVPPLDHCIHPQQMKQPAMTMPSWLCTHKIALRLVCFSPGHSQSVGPFWQRSRAERWLW